MPSDDSIASIQARLEPLAGAFRSAVTDAAEQVRSYRDAHAEPIESPAARVAAELGAFAAAHIDQDRFASLFDRSETLDAAVLRLLDRAMAVLKELSTPSGSTFALEVEPGGDVGTGVDRAFASIGRAFGAARVAELIRTGQHDAALDEDPGAPFPFHRWTAAERRIAPPLIVKLAGADLDATACATYLDGAQKIILLLDGPAPPAPLARLITPGTFVMQTTDEADLDRLSAFDGPGIAALVPDACAAFVHDPSEARAKRLIVMTRPESGPRALRRSSVFQQAEALALLDLLEVVLNGRTGPAEAGAAAAGASRAAPGPAAVAANVGALAEPAPQTQAASGTAADPADLLAAWLLSRAGLGAAAGSSES